MELYVLCVRVGTGLAPLVIDIALLCDTIKNVPSIIHRFSYLYVVMKHLQEQCMIVEYIIFRIIWDLAVLFFYNITWILLSTNNRIAGELRRIYNDINLLKWSSFRE